MAANFFWAKRASAVGLLAATLPLCGCVRMYQNWTASRSDGDARRASDAIAAAKDPAQKAAAYADRADAYAEKARYSRATRLIANDEYERLFQLAMQDYSQAIALNPENAKTYYRRGSAYYFRATQDMIYDLTPSPSLVPAKADFSKAVAKDPKNAMALDMLGLTDSSMRDWDDAIADFKQESALDAKWRFRLSDAYCGRGTTDIGDKKYDLAIADLNQAIAIRSNGDACDCDPYNPLLAVYLNQMHDYGKAQEVVSSAQRAGKWIDPDNLKQLKSLSASR